VLLAIAGLALTVVPAAGARSVAARANSVSPLEGRAVWVARPPQAIAPQQLVGEAGAAQARTLFVKAAEGGTPEPGFDAALAGTLRAAGIHLCAWTFVYGALPDAEAAAAVAAVRAGAQCLVVDAEGQYDSRYAAAQRYVRDLRAALGPRFPIGLAGQAEVLEHPKFPYSVFLGPGGFNVDMPQLYWRDLGLSVAHAFGIVAPQNLWYGRPIAPIGQLFNGVMPAEVAQFERAAGAFGSRGFSLFDLESAPAATIASELAVRALTKHRAAPVPASLGPGADGDEVVWAQEHLDGAGSTLPIGGFYGAQTARAVASFQRRHRLAASGIIDARTWRALLRVPPRVPSWAAAPPLSAL
jgi:hypothetical protein